jgi:hypothetical protein
MKRFYLREGGRVVEEPSSFSSLGMARSGCVSVVLRGCTVSVLSCCRLLTSLFAFRSYQKCQVLSANDDLEFPAPACGALLPLAPIGAFPDIRSGSKLTRATRTLPTSYRRSFGRLGCALGPSGAIFVGDYLYTLQAIKQRACALPL